MTCPHRFGLAKAPVLAHSVDMTRGSTMLKAERRIMAFIESWSVKEAMREQRKEVQSIICFG